MIYHIISDPISYSLQGIALQLPTQIQVRSWSAWQVHTYLQIVTVTRGSLSNNNWQCSFIFTSFPVFNYKWIAIWAQPVFSWTFYNTGMHVLSFWSEFEIFSCFVLAKCSMNRPQVGRTAEDDKWARKSIWNGGVLVLRCL